ncbi:hypothetical protein [Peribacillus kribbensis]|uniref:hypothetical protein n=1 Tax=Peribacillus kribbensis TaxID=356658 RepID=UPI0004145CFA|nr:hypothetical protein [Peribacillus kribbensis]
MEEEQLINAAMNVGVKVYPLSIYCAGVTGSVRVKILIGFGGLTETEIITGIKLLKKVWKL